VLVTILGIWIVSFSQKIPYVLIGMIIILVPHIVGAPEPEFFVGPTPPELASHFASRTLALGAASWVLLGYLSGYFWRKENS
jgi:predicted cobalt transporter CbtA